LKEDCGQGRNVLGDAVADEAEHMGDKGNGKLEKLEKGTEIEKGFSSGRWILGIERESRAGVMITRKEID